MSTTDHSHDGNARAASDIAAMLREANFVRLVAMPDGDALAATGVLARVLDVPFQASVTRTEIGESEADVTVSVGRSDGDVALTDEPVAASAVTVARALIDTRNDSEQELDPNVAVLALAGIVAAESDPEAHSDTLRVAGIDNRPGVGVPTADLTDGLAHTTLVHTPFSGDVEATKETLAAVDDDDRTIASMLALSAVDEEKTRASEAIERAVHPYVLDARTDDRGSGVGTIDGTQTPFATLEGYADVLDSLARSHPGTGLALTLGYDCHETALDGWRTHASSAHTAVRTANLVRHRGLVTADVPSGVDGTIETVARLVRDYRSLEPVVLAIAGDEVAGTAVGRDITTEVTEAASVVGASASGRGRCAYAKLGTDDETDRESEETMTEKTDAFVDAFREAL